MEKIIRTGLSLIMTALLITGCQSAEPGKKETLERLEEMCGGESFEINGSTVYSSDRDLEFTYWYEWEGTAIWPDIDISLGGKYVLYSSYGNAVSNY